MTLLTAVLGLWAAAAFSASGAPAKPKPLPPPKTLTLTTADGWTLAAEYRPPRRGKPAVIMVHGFSAGRGEWRAFAEILARRGWGSLALDLRGHGESLRGPKGPTTLEILEATRRWGEAERDLEAALAYLTGKGLAPSRIGLMGASLGANLVSRTARARPKLRFAVLLSPGRDYRGVLLEEKVGPRTLLAAASDDGYAFQTLVGLEARRSAHALLAARRGHGAEMLAEADFQAGLLKWLGLEERP